MGLNTTAATATVGQTMTAAFWNTEVRDAINGLQAAWVGYTPAMTASTTNPVQGSGATTDGAYYRQGHLIHGALDIVAGTSGTTTGSGAYEVSLPVAAVGGAAGKVIGHGYFLDHSTVTTYVIIGRILTTTTCRLYFNGNSAGTLGAGSGTIPGTWSTQDEIHLDFTYQAA